LDSRTDLKNRTDMNPTKTDFEFHATNTFIAGIAKILLVL
jgi:hypothetical protein